MRKKNIAKVLTTVLIFAGISITGLLLGERGNRIVFPEEIKEKENSVAASDSDCETNSQDIGSFVTPGSSDIIETEACVYVCGQVGKEGVYYLKQGSRIADAVEAAGGFTDRADRVYRNLAEPVVDGMKIYIPSVEEGLISKDTPGTDDGSQGAVQTKDGKVNINTADKTELMTLPGIGERKAEDILTFRKEHGSFANIEEIMLVPGIKDSSYRKLQPYICVK